MAASSRKRILTGLGLLLPVFTAMLPFTGSDAGAVIGFPVGGAEIPNTGASVTVTRFTLDPGTYLINAKAWFANAEVGGQDKAHYLQCSVVVQDASLNVLDSDTTRVTVPGALSSSVPGTEAAAFLIANTYTVPTTVTLNCNRFDHHAGTTYAWGIRVAASPMTASSIGPTHAIQP